MRLGCTLSASHALLGRNVNQIHGLAFHPTAFCLTNMQIRNCQNACNPQHAEMDGDQENRLLTTNVLYASSSGYFAEAWNSMCSQKWASPGVSRGSDRLPTRTWMQGSAVIVTFQGRVHPTGGPGFRLGIE